MKITYKAIWFFTALFFRGSVNFAQTATENGNGVIPVPGNSIVMPAGSQFVASKWKQLWWGKHWRAEWLAPVSFPVLDMDTTAKGLTPIKMGGGHQSKSIRVMGGDGKEYVLRSIDKTLDLLMPDEFKKSFVNEIANDQISTAHPYGPLVIANLSESIGILHTNPIITFVRATKKLGEFEKDFSNKLYLFEERPSGEGWDKTILIDYGSEVLNTEKLLVKLQKDHRCRVDQQEFLKIRLFDMIINDWDRHDDQWVWVAHKKNGEIIFRPFARDRDQAFSKTDGINLFLLSRPWALRSLQNMNSKVNDVIGINLAATSLDKQFLNGLSESDWRKTILSLQQLLSDSTIKKALQCLPTDIYQLSGEFLFARLRQRRDDLMNFGLRYYKILNKEVTIVGSDSKEMFKINRIDKTKTEVIVKNADNNVSDTATYYKRIFDHHVTKSINLFGLKGDDEFILSGSSKSKIQTRIIGGEGNDEFNENSFINGAGKRSRVYDIQADLPKDGKSYYFTHVADTSFLNYHRLGFKYDWCLPLIIPGYNPDDGFVIGAGLIYRKQQWQKKPFGWQQTFVANYAASTGAFSLYYNGIFKKTFGKWDFDLTADYKAPSFVVSFYGYGNDSKLLTDNKDYYRVLARSIFINPATSRSWNHITYKAGVLFNAVKIEASDDKYISHSGPTIDSSIFSYKYFAGVNLSYRLSTINSIKYPTKGLVLDITSTYQLNLEETNRNILNLQSGFSFYYKLFRNITLAHRTGAATIFGDFEFYQASTLGGLTNLRGYWRTRFAGRSSFYQNTDIRWKIADLKGYVFRGALGIYGFFDDGRVWVKDENSSTLHTGYGGGIYFIPYNALAINVSFASSNEVNVFTVRTGFLF